MLSLVRWRQLYLLCPRQIHRRSGIARPHLGFAEQREADESPHFQAAIGAQFNFALVGTAALGIVDAAAGPLAVVVILEAAHDHLSTQYLIASRRIGIVAVELAGFVAADNAALQSAVSRLGDLDDAVPGFGEPVAQHSGLCLIRGMNT